MNKKSFHLGVAKQGVPLAVIIGLIVFSGVAQADVQRVKDHEYKTMDIISNINDFDINDERLRRDSAIAHYNMGNIYFHKGEYEIAAREYFQAVTLMPNDPDVHFNLAFVSGEHLKDFSTAIKHYRMYLYLNPEAKDRGFVNQKILRAQLKVRGQMPETFLHKEEKAKGK